MKKEKAPICIKLQNGQNGKQEPSVGLIFFHCVFFENFYDLSVDAK